MNNEVTAVADRLLAVNWAGSFDRTRSRATLMREYLRRAAWWARATSSPDWPFFDIAAAVDPSVRADPEIVRRVLTQLDGSYQGVQVQRAAERALHFAALLDSGRPLPELPDSVRRPFEPLLQLFERGGGYRIEGSGLIEVDTAGLRRGTLEENLSDQPVPGLDQLDSLD